MITLFTYGRMFGLPDPSPFVMKAEMLLKIAGVPYQADTSGFRRAPKGKLPYIDDDGTVVADSTLIRLHLEKKHGVDFDAGLSERERGVAWAVEKLLEDHLYWVMVKSRWLVPANFDRGPRNFFKRAPAFLRPLIVRTVLGKVRQTLHLHGLGRHSETELADMAARGIAAVSQVLGERRYLMGDRVCGADATAFAFIAGLLAPLFDSPQRAYGESLPNLVAYRDRMMAEFYDKVSERKAA